MMNRALRGAVVSMAIPLVASAQSLSIASPAFDGNARIPTLHGADGACGGQNVTPGVAWRGTPSAAKSVVIVLAEADREDVLWIAYGIAADRGEVREGEGQKDDVGILVGRNSTGTASYRGMCPPAGDPPHRYLLTVVATDLPVTAFGPGLVREEILRLLKGHELASGRVEGRYAR